VSIMAETDLRVLVVVITSYGYKTNFGRTRRCIFTTKRGVEKDARFPLDEPKNIKFLIAAMPRII